MQHQGLRCFPGIDYTFIQADPSERVSGQYQAWMFFKQTIDGFQPRGMSHKVLGDCFFMTENPGEFGLGRKAGEVFQIRPDPVKELVIG